MNRVRWRNAKKARRVWHLPGPFNIGSTAGLWPGPHFFWKNSLAYVSALIALNRPDQLRPHLDFVYFVGTWRIRPLLATDWLRWPQ
jgi:hypothetical protein